MALYQAVQVVNSNPKGVFEDEAIKAIKKWRFKPSLEDDKSSFKNATITFNFKLAR